MYRSAVSDTRWASSRSFVVIGLPRSNRRLPSARTQGPLDAPQFALETYYDEL
jgi:hypothetical protein